MKVMPKFFLFELDLIFQNQLFDPLFFNEFVLFLTTFHLILYYDSLLFPLMATLSRYLVFLLFKIFSLLLLALMDLSRPIEAFLSSNSIAAPAAAYALLSKSWSLCRPCAFRRIDIRRFWLWCCP